MPVTVHEASSSPSEYTCVFQFQLSEDSAQGATASTMPPPCSLLSVGQIRFRVHSVNYPPIPLDQGTDGEKKDAEPKDVKPFAPMVVTVPSGYSPYVRARHVQAQLYLKAAEGGYVRAMYNTSLCYFLGEGLPQSHKLARRWMRKAADRGHVKAQSEHEVRVYAKLRNLNDQQQLQSCTWHTREIHVQTGSLSGSNSTLSVRELTS